MKFGAQGLALLFVLGGMATAHGQAWEIHTAPVLDGGIQITPPDVGQLAGFTILVQKGETITLAAKVIDVDRRLKASSTEYEYKNDDGEVIWTKTGGGTLSPARTASGAATTYTAPTTTGTYQITATPDDKPTLADDNPGSGMTLNVKVVDGCPDSIGNGSNCTPVPEWTYWKTYGKLCQQRCVSGGTPPNPPNNWNGLVIREVVVPKSNSCGASDFNISPDCTGHSSWVVGSGTSGYFDDHCSPKCYCSNADNCFWDHFWRRSSTQTWLVAGHGPCIVKCSQTYFCKDTPIGGFILTFTYTMEAGHCKVDVSSD